MWFEFYESPCARGLPTKLRLRRRRELQSNLQAVGVCAQLNALDMGQAAEPGLQASTQQPRGRAFGDRVPPSHNELFGPFTPEH